MFCTRSSRKYRLLLSSFFLPFIILMASFAINQLAPFGSNSLALKDAKNQYISYYSFFVDTIKENNSFLYTLKTVLGGPVSGLYAYYLASPFTLIYLLFPNSQILLVFDLIQALKYACCGLTMAVFFQERGLLSKSTLVFTTAYALCGFNLVLGWCSMWVDAVYMLPLIATGLHRIVFDKNPYLYIFSLGISIIICYYTGFMLCVFSVFYYSYLCLSNYKSGCLLNLRLFLLSSLASGGLSSVVLLPAWGAMQGNSSLDTPIDSIRRYSYPAMTRVCQLFFPSASSITVDKLITPLLVGILLLFVFLLIVLIKVLISSKYNCAKKLIICAFVFMFFELWYYLIEQHVYTYGIGRELNTTWAIHKLFFGEAYGYEIANGSPNVYCGPYTLFLAVLWFFNKEIKVSKKQAALLVLFMFYVSFRFELPNMLWHILSQNRMYNYRFSFICSFFLLTLAAENMNNRHGLDTRHGIAAIILINVSAVCSISLVKTYMPSTSLIVNILVLLICGTAVIISFWKPESFVAVLICIGLQFFSLFWTTVQNEHYQAREALSITSYQDLYFQIDDKLSNLSEYDSDVYRIRNNGTRLNVNDPMSFGYYGLSHFSSTDHADSIDFMKQIGVRTLSGRWANANSGQSRAADALLGVKYTFKQYADYKPTRTGFWKNPYAFPMAILFSRQDADSSPVLNKNAAEYLNSIYRELGSDLDVFRELNMAQDGEVHIPNEDPVYLQVGKTVPKHLSIRINGNDISVPVSLYPNGLIYLGMFSADDTLIVSSSVQNEQSNYQIYQESSSVLLQMCSALQSQVCRLDFVNDGNILCHTDTESKEKTLMFMFPYEKAWHVKIDGKRNVPQKALDHFLSVEVSPGEHSIELRYIPSGLFAGSSITILTIALVYYFWIRSSRTKNIKKTKQIS